jgi:hypothetical protein
VNTRWDTETTRRWLGIAGAAAVIAFPIALIAATWEPLEPLPRAERPALVDGDATPERTREDRRHRRENDAGAERTPRRDSNRSDPAPALATPPPGANE